MIDYKDMTPNEIAIEDAQKDAMFYGAGWLRVDCYGNLTRINPVYVGAVVLPEEKEQKHG